MQGEDLSSNLSDAAVKKAPDYQKKKSFARHHVLVNRYKDHLDHATHIEKEFIKGPIKSTTDYLERRADISHIRGERKKFKSDARKYAYARSIERDQKSKPAYELKKLTGEEKSGNGSVVHAANERSRYSGFSSAITSIKSKEDKHQLRKYTRELTKEYIAAAGQLKSNPKNVHKVAKHIDHDLGRRASIIKLSTINYLGKRSGEKQRAITDKSLRSSYEQLRTAKKQASQSVTQLVFQSGKDNQPVQE